MAMGRFRCPNIGTHFGNNFWLNYEPCGFICGSMTWFLVLYASYSFTFNLIQPWIGFNLHGFFHIVVFNIMCILAVYAHVQTMITDPGAVPRDAKPLPTDTSEHDIESNAQFPYKKYCKRCKAFKPARAHHCSLCNRCIVKMDHHCPWVNNCVGIANHKLFILFLVFINALCWYALLLIILRFFFCHHNCGTPFQNIHIIFLLVESILFGMFTICMLADQLETVSTNLTQIDRLKGQLATRSNSVEVNEVFGTPKYVKFDWRWLIPQPAVFPDEVRDTLFGFCCEKDAELVSLISSPLRSSEETITADEYPVSSSELKEYKAS